MMSQIAHLPFYLADPRCEVGGVAESRPSLMRHLREEIGVERVVEEPAELYADPTLAAVVIIAPRPAAGPLALAALTAGKHVFVEKPLAHTVCQAARLVDAAHAKKLTLAVGYMKRYDPGVQVAKREFDELRASGALGPLLLARFYDFARDYARTPPPHKRPEESRTRRFETWPTTPSWLPASRAEDHAWFMNAASHDVNLVRFFFPSELHVVSAASPAAGIMAATFHSDGATVLLELAKSASGAWIQGAEFVFERGRLLLELPSPMARGEAARVTISQNGNRPRVVELEVEPVWCFQKQAEGFISALLEHRRPLTSGEDAMDELRLTEALWRAALQ